MASSLNTTGQARRAAPRNSLRADSPVPASATVSDLVDRYSETCPSRSDLAALARFRRQLGNVKLQSITTPMLCDFINRRSEAGADLHLLVGDLRAISALLTWAKFAPHAACGASRRCYVCGAQPEDACRATDGEIAECPRPSLAADDGPSENARLAQQLEAGMRKPGLSEQQRFILSCAAAWCHEECLREQDESFQSWLQQTRDVLTWRAGVPVGMWWRLCCKLPAPVACPMASRGHYSAGATCAVS